MTYRLASLMLLTCLAAGCHPDARMAPGGDLEALAGVVRFPGYQTQTTYAEVAAAATVSLIDPETNETKATSLTDARGRFSLSFRSIAAGHAVYYLEAIKGLGNNAVGHDAVRVRTLVQRQWAGWTSLTNAVAGAGLIAINSGTTALCVIASLRQATSPVPPAWLLGRLAMSGDDSTPDAFDAATTSITVPEYTQAWTLVSSALGGNRDPFDAILYDGATYSLKPTAAPHLVLADVTPGAASGGETLVLRGSGFAATPGGNTVTFAPGLAAVVTAASSTSLQVTVPTGAVTGDLRVTVGPEFATTSFTCIPPIGGGLNP